MPNREDFDPAIVGSRASDGDFISFREAIKMFATKEELASMHTALQMVVTRVDALPGRDEMAVRWQRDDEYKTRFETSLATLQGGIDELKSDRLPKWALPVAALIAPAVFGFIILVLQHFWR